MPDDASEALDRLRNDMIESANGFVPSLGPQEAYAAGVFQMFALKAVTALDEVLKLTSGGREVNYPSGGELVTAWMVESDVIRAAIETALTGGTGDGN